MAYNDTDDNANAKAQFERAVSLDDKFARPIMDLGRLSIAQSDYEAAEKYFQKAALLRPTDIDVLTALAYSQDSNRHFEEAIQTVERIHVRAHRGMGNAHYISASAALALTSPTLSSANSRIFCKRIPPIRSLLTLATILRYCRKTRRSLPVRMHPWAQRTPTAGPLRLRWPTVRG